ncbi:YbfB/YjiJ family MFS transporter [Nocardiopsis gilva]|uniref:YbfB/YjiJ family MFS transporter n=1 Tax=Nocardiopsis gilva TaxID=280236 RepID=UPI001E346011|nr:YbfB/YjiJ family MFS transporter [Nocardiopsis gilva]
MPRASVSGTSSTGTDDARNERRLLWRAAVVLAAAMGIGRFVYTPILPMMEQQAGLSAVSGAQIATANYLGYIAGAVLLSVLPSLATSRVVARGSLALLVATLASMPLVTTAPAWMALRFLAGVASAVIFIVAAQALLRTLRRNPHLSGWSYGGVGLGIALSGTVVLVAGPATSWPVFWYLSAVLALLLGAPVWTLIDRAADPREAASGTGGAGPGPRRAFQLLLAGYFLEGVGYIIAATFLVAALAGSGLTWLGNGAWVLVGVAAIPSCVLWSYWSRRVSRPTLLVMALLVQAAAVALPGVTENAAMVVVSAVLFGGTFMGITTLALAAGAELNVPRSAAALTTAYGLGQVLGPLIVQPTLDHGYQPALLIGGAILVAGAVVVLLLRTFSWPGAPVPTRRVSSRAR